MTTTLSPTFTRVGLRDLDNFAGRLMPPHRVTGAGGEGLVFGAHRGLMDLNDHPIALRPRHLYRSDAG